MMIQIEDIVVSSDIITEKFLCNLEACKGECCIEGDAGAPVEESEVKELEKVLPVVWDELSPEAKAIIEKQGVVYTDKDGDLVTSIVNNKDCVFTCYDDVVIVPSRRLIARENVISINRFRVISIRFELEIMDYIRRSIIIGGMCVRRRLSWEERKMYRFINS